MTLAVPARAHRQWSTLEAAAWLVAALTFFVSAVALSGLVSPRSPFGDLAAALLPAPHVHASRARAAIAASPPNWGLARRQILDEGPRAGPDARLRLAYVDIKQDRRLSQEGVAALIASYDAAPLDARLAAWRIPIVLEAWPDVPARLRSSVLREMTTLWTKAGQRRWLRGLPDRVANPAGRLAVTLEVAVLEALPEASAR